MNNETNVNILKESEAFDEEIKSIRRALHSIAETGFEITKTKALIKDFLAKLGIKAEECGGGIKALITPQKTASTSVLLRADCDALPVKEESGLPFSAENGSCHACGHDMHTAMLLFAAKLLVSHREWLTQNVILAFQGAEETLEGAVRMLEDGIIKGESCTRAYSIHVLPLKNVKCGAVIIPPAGDASPHAQFFEIIIKGKSAHGAAPQNSKDALLCGCAVANALQLPISREKQPTVPSLLTLGSFSAGSAANVIAETCTIKGTLRSFDKGECEMLTRRVFEISEHISRAYGCKAQVRVTSSCPSLKNDAAVRERAVNALSSAFGDALIDARDADARNIGGSEDFSFFSHAVSSLLLGISAGDCEGRVLHDPAIRFDEDSLTKGAAALAICALSGEKNS